MYSFENRYESINTVQLIVMEKQCGLDFDKIKRCKRTLRFQVIYLTKMSVRCLFVEAHELDPPVISQINHIFSETNIFTERTR